MKGHEMRRYAASEDVMIRRNAVLRGRDQKVVKVWLIAAAFALSLGFVAQHAIEAEQAEAKSMAGQTLEQVEALAENAAGKAS